MHRVVRDVYPPFAHCVAHSDLRELSPFSACAEVGIYEALTIMVRVDVGRVNLCGFDDPQIQRDLRWSRGPFGWSLLM